MSDEFSAGLIVIGFFTGVQQEEGIFEDQKWIFPHHWERILGLIRNSEIIKVDVEVMYTQAAFTIAHSLL